MPAGQLGDVLHVAKHLSSGDSEEDLFVADTAFAQALYLLMVTYHKESELPIVEVHLTFPWLNFQTAYVAADSKDIDSLDRSLVKVKPLIARAEEVGGVLKLEKKVMPVASIDDLATKVERTANERLRNSLADYHAISMVEEYMKGSESTEARMHAELSLRYNATPRSPFANNIGYLMMSWQKNEVAKGLFKLEKGSAASPKL